MSGHSLHHHPYFEMNGEEDRQRQREGFAVTQQLWKDTFGASTREPERFTLESVFNTI